MSDASDFLTILRCHFPIFICAFFAAVFSMSLAMIILMQHYPPTLADYPKTLMGASSFMSLYLCFANFLVIRGRPWGVWLVVAAMLACLLAVLPHSGYRTPGFMYVLGLLLPLVTLLLLNSKRHRVMREVMVSVRAERAAQRRRKK